MKKHVCSSSHLAKREYLAHRECAGFRRICSRARIALQELSGVSLWVSYHRRFKNARHLRHLSLAIKSNAWPYYVLHNVVQLCITLLLLVRWCWRYFPHSTATSSTTLRGTHFELNSHITFTLTVFLQSVAASTRKTRGKLAELFASLCEKTRPALAKREREREGGK